jgi:hypothetical protein
VQTGNHPHKRNCNASKRYITATPISIKASIKRELIAMLHHRSDQMPRLLPTLARRKHPCEKHGGAANVSLPSNMQLSKNAVRARSAPNPGFVAGGAL